MNNLEYICPYAVMHVDLFWRLFGLDRQKRLGEKIQKRCKPLTKEIRLKNVQQIMQSKVTL